MRCFSPGLLLLLISPKYTAQRSEFMRRQAERMYMVLAWDDQLLSCGIVHPDAIQKELVSILQSGSHRLALLFALVLEHSDRVLPILLINEHADFV